MEGTAVKRPQRCQRKDCGRVAQLHYYDKKWMCEMCLARTIRHELESESKKNGKVRKHATEDE